MYLLYNLDAHSICAGVRNEQYDDVHFELEMHEMHFEYLYLLAVPQ